MSFLLKGEDAEVVLEDALAFIESCDGSAGAGHNTSSESDSSRAVVSGVEEASAVLEASGVASSEAATLPGEQLAAHEKPSAVKKKKRRAPGASTRLLHRKKAELAELRDQAQELEARLTQLKRVNNMPGEVSGAETEAVASSSRSSELSEAAASSGVLESQQNPRSVWFSAALKEYRARMKSEETNRQLRVILANQERTNGTLRGVLASRSVLQGADLALRNEPRSIRYSLVHTANSTLVVEVLEKMVSDLYLDSGAVLSSAQSTPPSLSSSWKMKLDRRRGKTLEMAMTTPMSCPMEKASELLWEDLASNQDCVDKIHRFVRNTQQKTIEKNYLATTRGSAGTMQTNAMQFVRKYEESDRIVLVRSSLLMTPIEGLQFRDECWMSIARSESDPEHASVVRTFMQLYMDSPDDLSPEPDDLKAVREFALGAVSTRVREYHEAQQTTLIQEAGRISLAPQATS